MPTNTGQTDAPPSAKQLVFLAMVATVVVVIVFLCGVLVGRGVPAGRATRLVVTETAPTEAGTVGIGVPDLGADPQTASGSPLDALSYFDLLSSAEPAPEPLDATIVVPDGGLTPGARAPESSQAIVVQVTALRDGDDARAVAARLVASGYPAFVLDPMEGVATPVFRVRVGPYANQDEAETALQRLATEEQFEPWIIQR